MTKTTRLYWKKLNKKQTNRKTSQVHGLKRLILLKYPGYSWACLGQFLVGVTAPNSWVLVRTRFCLCAPRVFPVLYKFWWFYGGVNGDHLQEGLCHTQVCCTQSPCSSPLLTCTSVGDTQTQFVSISVGSLGPGAHKVCLSPLSVSGGYGVWF